MSHLLTLKSARRSNDYSPNDTATLFHVKSYIIRKSRTMCSPFCLAQNVLSSPVSVKCNWSETPP